MKHLAIILFSAFVLSACAPQQKLYSWGQYQDKSYNYLKNSDEKSVEELILVYKSIIEKQTGTRKVVPPGLYADYGFLLIQNNKVAEGRSMLTKEIELYPESKIFLEKILKMTEK